eukprot:Skav221790  [mRNA]  locus=scaffold4067:104399:111491:- [translate_table: standard]
MLISRRSQLQVRLETLTSKLDDLRDEMRGLGGKHLTLQALEEIRGGILSGRRIELPSAQRQAWISPHLTPLCQHLERGSPMISEVTFDARHTDCNAVKLCHWVLQILSNNIFKCHVFVFANCDERITEVQQHAFLHLKKSPGSKAPMLAPPAPPRSKLSIYSLENEPLLDRFDLGHEGKVMQLELSPTQDENHFVVSVGEDNDVRVHNIKEGLKVVCKCMKEQGAEKDDEQKEKPKDKDISEFQDARMLNVTASLATQFSLSHGDLEEAQELTRTEDAKKRGSQTFFIAGDSLGGVSVFFRNGTMRGRVRVTEDPGGVKGLIRAQAGQQQVLFYSSHAFGFFSPSQVELQYPPCTGWNSRVLLALQDGDILVYATTRGKSKAGSHLFLVLRWESVCPEACDLALKFPHVSVLPFKLHSFRGTALINMVSIALLQDEYVREIFFFNMARASMENGYGSAPSRAITLQASFKPKQPETLAMLGQPGPSGSCEKAKSQVAIRFKDAKGIELYDLTLRTPPPPKAAADNGSSSGWDINSILNWFPKVGVFGIALIGVIFWNIKKARVPRQDSTQRRHAESILESW